MLAGAWGARAGELLERAAERHQARIHCVGELAMLAAPDTMQDKWSCWLFGEPEDRGELSARFGLRTRAELPTAFGRALIELGERACELLGGRFVVVALDREREHCLVVRDHLGAQPLVYTSVGNGVLFAEHERDLLDLLPATPSPDRLALLRWINNGLVPRLHTLYEGVQRLPAGHRLTLGEGRTQVERWWRIHYQGTDQGSPIVLGERLRDTAFAAVGRAAAGSRRPAVKLSGGLDSACVAAGLTANGFTDGRALAIGGTFSDYPATDERELIEATGRHTQLPLEQIAFKSDSSMLAPALEHIARWRLPPATPNLFLWQPVMARARELGVDLMLDGEGGDELFGLARYLIADRVRSGRLLGAWSLTRRIPGLGQHPDRRLRLHVLRRYGLAPLVPSAVQHRREQRRIASSGSIVPRADAQTLLDLRIADEQDRHDGPLWWRYQVESVIDLRDTLDMGGHFRREAADAAIDIRHPLLYDLPLIEAALRLPPRAQFDPLRDRPLLREGLTGLIPEAVRTRHEKSHFTPLVLAGISAEEARLIEPLRATNAAVRSYVAGNALDMKIGVAREDRSMLGAGSLWRVAIANQWLEPQTG
ncbi:MAG TPA: asparagine synthase-related protein [Solirubrobacteraceae bacterium]|jgi:asparagine synthase (glutamine-hydrolysing)|nr:asparagine synthase-related protein [Solirubrobacteraceae bacterium]